MTLRRAFWTAFYEGLIIGSILGGGAFAGYWVGRAAGLW